MVLTVLCFFIAYFIYTYIYIYLPKELSGIRDYLTNYLLINWKVVIFSSSDSV